MLLEKIIIKSATCVNLYKFYKIIKKVYKKLNLVIEIKSLRIHN